MEVKINSPFAQTQAANSNRRNYFQEFVDMVEWALEKKPDSVTIQRALNDDGSPNGNKTNAGRFAITASEDLFAEYYGERTNYPPVYAVDYPRYFSMILSKPKCNKSMFSSL
jgi:hypothetical protein